MHCYDALPYVIAWVIALVFISAGAVVGALLPFPYVVFGVSALAALQVALRFVLMSIASLQESDG